MDLAALEFNRARGQGEQGEVFSGADIKASCEFGADLADDDRAGFGGLATVQLHAAVLGIGIAAVLSGTLAFFVCHDGAPLLWSL